MNKREEMMVAAFFTIVSVPVIIIGALQNANTLLVGLLCGLLAYAIMSVCGTRTKGIAFSINEKISMLAGFLAILLASEIHNVTSTGTLAAGFAAMEVCVCLLAAVRSLPSTARDPV